ncbi:hypothetical protein HJFPF1_12050 [Paramyrothecium foliicola]|nr:hypothetical protein HJFPF1_12050 [Paramyrothecium foliicola]
MGDMDETSHELGSPRLPQGDLTVPASRFKRLAEAVEAAEVPLRQVGRAKDPIEAFNQLDDQQKELVMKQLLRNFGRFFCQGGANLAPVDMEYYSKVGLPDTERSLMRGAQLSTGSQIEIEHGDGDKVDDTGRPTKHKSEGEDGTMHGHSCWPRPPPTTASGSRPVLMDDSGRVDLRHDAHDLRKHFTSRWAVMDQPCYVPRTRAAIWWDDNDFYLKVNGEHAGLCVDKYSRWEPRPEGETKVCLVDLISSPLLLYRIVASFAAPPCTDNDHYKVCWSFVLWNVEDPTCSLEIREHKGWPVAKFCGGEKKASVEAVQLIEWLTSDNCPHSYDYTPCGRHA